MARDGPNQRAGWLSDLVDEPSNGRPLLIRMKNPPHPGRSIRDACLEPLGLTVTAGARVLGVTRATLSNLINGRSGVSPEMAIRLARAFGGSPETWLRLQMQYDLAQALRNEAALDVQPVRRTAA